ncbi:MAG: Isochorismate synthase of siderophore biosynthesis, partial [uncultured Corynebacteriales bacterium]
WWRTRWPGPRPGRPTPRRTPPRPPAWPPRPRTAGSTRWWWTPWWRRCGRWPGGSTCRRSRRWSAPRGCGTWAPGSPPSWPTRRPPRSPWPRRCTRPRRCAGCRGTPPGRRSPSWSRSTAASTPGWSAGSTRPGTASGRWPCGAPRCATAGCGCSPGPGSWPTRTRRRSWPRRPPSSRPCWTRWARAAGR